MTGFDWFRSQWHHEGMHKRVILGAAAALALTLTACGAEPSPSPSSTSPEASASPDNAGPSPRPSSTFPIPDEEPETVPSAEDLLRTGGAVSPYEFLHVQLTAQRAATYVTTTTTDPQWDTERIIHIDRSDPAAPIFYVRTETSGQVTELLERGGMRYERTGDGQWQETIHDPAQPDDVHTAATQQAAQYSSVELVSTADQLFRLLPYDLGMVPALMYVDSELRPVLVQSEGLEGRTVYTYDEPMELPVVE